jgi:hypothetical protein
LNRLSSIIKNHQTVCWYPSAGADLNAIHYWNKGIGNIFSPTLFILTDVDYLIHDESLNFYKNDGILYKIPPEFTIEKENQVLNLRSIQLLILKTNNIEVILLRSKNEHFHNHCITNGINIDCLLLHRPTDNFCNDVNFANTLNMKEGIVGPSYTSYPKESLTISDMVWESPFNNPDFKNSVAFIKYTNN